ncbi:hypothetical protein AURDEDRAFT_178155 [Auricularia subglabra TFB-10046 SS5]|uniref:Uncharacterized protein n=1 Tax=Auricularia subglabra (strain TFB-10046 / SS5) TaxID=717982 RepID=J0CR62_AURST|nr:hypothetical protein AURDEDRAFT_178155 [Auricularia subglabra TFB-10046 SS5]
MLLIVWKHHAQQQHFQSRSPFSASTRLCCTIRTAQPRISGPYATQWPFDTARALPPADPVPRPNFKTYCHLNHACGAAYGRSEPALAVSGCLTLGALATCRCRNIWRSDRARWNTILRGIGDRFGMQHVVAGAEGSA